MPEPRNTVTEQTQFRRVIEAARELECDDDKDRFERRLGKIARAKPRPPKNERP